MRAAPRPGHEPSGEGAAASVALPYGRVIGSHPGHHREDGNATRARWHLGRNCGRPVRIRNSGRTEHRQDRADPASGQFADPGAQADNGVRLYMQRARRHRRRQEDRDHPQGHRRHRARCLQTAGAGTDRPRQGRHARRLLADAERDGRGRCVGAGQEVHGGDERGGLDRDHEVALPGAGVVHAAATERAARHLGAQERRPQSVLDGGGLCRRSRRRNRVPHRLQGRGRRDRRRGSLSGREPGFLGVRAARQGPEPGGDLYLRAGRRAVAGDRQGAGRPRHRSAQDQDHGAASN